MISQRVREYYQQHAAMSSLGADTGAFNSVAQDPTRVAAAVAKTVQGLLVYDVVSTPWYGVEPDLARADEVNLRSVRELLTRARALDPSPFVAGRPPLRRVFGRCRDFTLLAVALFRELGIPARSRCGFATYFNSGRFEDHWVAEYWSDTEHRWVMVDAQLDQVWQKMISFRGNPLDITASEFVVAGRAWQECRSGTLDPLLCGLSAINQQGLFWVAGNTRLDVAALNKVEMLPWDVWGMGWSPTSPVPDDLAPFDSLAELSAHPDVHFDALLGRYAGDDMVRVGTHVFNVLRNQSDDVSALFA